MIFYSQLNLEYVQHTLKFLDTLGGVSETLSSQVSKCPSIEYASNIGLPPPKIDATQHTCNSRTCIYSYMQT